MKKLVLAAVAAILGLAPAGDGLVVHEWGTFTTVSGSDGVPMHWRPLDGASDLPKFVVRAGLPKGFEGKDAGWHIVRMETPVLYFYSPRETEVSVKVGFPKGRITELYPAARDTRAGIDWGKVRVLPGADVTLPREKGESHYYPARETDAAPVRVGDQFEKFLFYRGVGNFDLQVRAMLEGGRVTVKNGGADPVAEAILFENRGGRVGWRTLGRLEGQVTVDRPATDGNLEHLLAEIEAMLVRTGLYSREAAAMVKTWRDTWFEEGLRVFYLVPARKTDEILPLTLDPKPSEVVRTLVGRAELITPELERAVLALSEKMQGTPEARREAAQAFRKLGRFAQPALWRVQGRAKDDEARKRLTALLVEASRLG